MSKKQSLLSIFPLPEVVLFPGMDLPLHIFEDRYKEMILNCLNSDKHFGIVYLKDTRCAEVGTKAEVVDVEKLEDGKMNILAEGRSRFKILDLVKEEPYHQALIEPFDDTNSSIDSKVKITISKIRELSEKALLLYDSISDEELSKKLKLPKEPNELLFLVAANLTCSYDQKQTILETRSSKDRSKQILKLLKEEIKRLEILLENKQTKNEVIKNGKLKI